MKRIALVIASLFAGISTYAQTLSYDVDFQYFFHNTEYARSNNVFEDSHTLHAARLTPTVNLGWSHHRKVSHDLSLGIDIYKNMGDGLSGKDLFKEITLFYKAEAQAGKGVFSAIAGVFPRSFSEGSYSGAFFSREETFLNNNFEGMFLKYRKRGLYAELGLDWMGMYGYDRREQFQILSAGNAGLSPTFSLGWSASVYHFANSELEKGVVDNAMVNPYLQADFTRHTDFQVLSIKAGPIVTYQRDRKREQRPQFPSGGESVQTFKNWNFGLSNTIYVGQNLFLYYDRYQDRLYHGEPFYYTHADHLSWFDRLELFYEPEIASWLNLRIDVAMHFGEEMSNCPLYRGMQQTLSLKVNLDRLRRR